MSGWEISYMVIVRVVIVRVGIGLVGNVRIGIVLEPYILIYPYVFNTCIR